MSIIQWTAIDDLLREMAAEGKNVTAMHERSGLCRDTIRKRLLKLGVYKSRKTGVPNDSKPWSKDSDRRLLEMDTRHVPHPDIANELGRSIPSIRVRLSVLKKQAPPPAPQPKPAKPQQCPNFSVIATAKAELGSRLTERKGIMFLDGKLVNSLDIIKTAHASLTLRGAMLPGTKPEKWM
jgi:hypothetical protein